MNLLICGTDAVAVDSICAALTGKQPTDFNFLRLAKGKKVGETDPARIEVLGEKLAEHIYKDFIHIKESRPQMIPRWVPSFIVTFARRLLLDRPVLLINKCKKCGACSTICAAKAITPKKGSPSFDYSKCIRCFCCQEMCQYKAIKIKKSWFTKAIYPILQSIFNFT
jgi:ferredoxin